MFQVQGRLGLEILNSSLPARLRHVGLIAACPRGLLVVEPSIFRVLSLHGIEAFIFINPGIVKVWVVTPNESLGEEFIPKFPALFFCCGRVNAIVVICSATSNQDVPIPSIRGRHAITSNTIYTR